MARLYRQKKNIQKPRVRQVPPMQISVSLFQNGTKNRDFIERLHFADVHVYFYSWVSHAERPPLEEFARTVQTDKICVIKVIKIHRNLIIGSTLYESMWSSLLTLHLCDLHESWERYFGHSDKTYERLLVQNTHLHCTITLMHGFYWNFIIRFCVIGVGKYGFLLPNMPK